MQYNLLQPGAASISPNQFLKMTVHWYAFRCKPNKEVFVYEQLLARRIETFLPMLRVQVVNPRARKRKPYFPGYLFIHADLAQTGFSALNWLPGGLGLVCFDSVATPVPDSLIAALRKRLDEIEAAGGELFDGLKPGDVLEIQSGPFAGYEAIFDARLSGSDRVRVLLKLLRGRLLEVDLPAGQLSKKQTSKR